MKVTLYSIGCNNCNVLKSKLQQVGIKFEEVTDEEYMISLGLDSMPVLEVDGQRMEYLEAVRWVNNQKGAV